MYDLCVIGGGAAGILAAIRVKQRNHDLKVILLEKNDRLGKKLLATGNGRCNISNINCDNHQYVLSYFNELGVVTKQDEDGRFYPYSEEAYEVVKVLEMQLKIQGVDIYLECEVIDIENDECNGFEITINRKGFDGKKSTFMIDSKRVLIATGGKAAPSFGTIGDGYKWARNMGHSISKLKPKLAPIECVGDFTFFRGIRQYVNLKLYRDDDLIFTEKGNLQMTEYGISGICVFNLSRYIELDEGESLRQGMKRFHILIDFLPEFSSEQLFELLMYRRKLLEFDALALFKTLVKEPIAFEILKRLGIDFRVAKSLGNDELLQIVHELKAYRVDVSSVRGWKNAQVTGGGVALEELNLETMESQIIKGLYFAGEIIDYDGPCGGYNLQNAWETAIKVADDVSRVSE